MSPYLELVGIIVHVHMYLCVNMDIKYMWFFFTSGIMIIH